MDKAEASVAKFILYLDPVSGYRWVLRSGKERISDSIRAYETKAECEREIEAAKKHYPEAVVRDLTR